MELRKSIEDIINCKKSNIAVAIKNLNTNETIMINQDKVFYSASTIKLLIMSEVLRQVKEGKHSLDELITLTDDKKVAGAGILKEFNSGHKFTIREIMTLMIVLSDNIATNMLIDLTGIDNINKMASRLNLKNTVLQRKMMDAIAAKAGMENKTCAEDLLHILELIYKGEDVDKKYSDIMIDILKRQQVTGRLDLYLPAGTVIAHKTGTLDKLEHDVGIVYLPNCTYIICVLTSNDETNIEGKEVIGMISKKVYDMYK